MSDDTTKPADESLADKMPASGPVGDASLDPRGEPERRDEANAKLADTEGSASHIQEGVTVNGLVDNLQQWSAPDEAPEKSSDRMLKAVGAQMMPHH